MLLGLYGKPAIEPGAPFPALECDGGKAAPGLPCQVSTDGMSSIPILEGGDNSIEGFWRISVVSQVHQFRPDKNTAIPPPLLW